MHKINDKTAQSTLKPKKQWPALVKAALFVLAVLLITLVVLKLYQWQVDNFNDWSGLDFPPYDSEQTKTISIAIFAIFSLMALLWRSIISAAQVKELQAQGRRTETQIENTKKQIEQTEVKNLTELFTKGVELINTPEPDKNSALVLAGISILHQVALRQDGLFRKQVQNILAQNILDKAIIKPNGPLYFMAALDILDEFVRQYNEDIFIDIIIIVESDFYDDKAIYYHVNNIFYKDCEISQQQINPRNNHFIGCSFIGCEIIEDISIIGGASFYHCSIKSISYDSTENFCRVYDYGINKDIFISDNKLVFYMVDFTNCDNWMIIPEVLIEFEKCRYDPENPPVEELKKLIDAANKKASKKLEFIY